MCHNAGGKHQNVAQGVWCLVPSSDDQMSASCQGVLGSFLLSWLFTYVLALGFSFESVILDAFSDHHYVALMKDEYGALVKWY